MAMNTEDIARVCHEANRAYCKTLGDDSQPAWDDAPDWQKSSALNGVKFYSQAPWTPKAAHENWCEQKRREGWVCGPKKDPEALMHPCLVPWDELPPDQKRKDFLFAAICQALMEDI